MVYRFTIISDEVEDFMREISIDAEAHFLELHKLILESCGYKDDQLTSFTLCENGWEKVTDITLEEIDTDADVDSFTMGDTKLRELLEEEKQHLLYTFDPLADRVFFIELSEIKVRQHMDEGKVTKSKGSAPQQTIDFDDLFTRTMQQSSSSIFDEEDLYGNEVSDEELGMEGLEFSDDLPYQ